MFISCSFVALVLAYFFLPEVSSYNPKHSRLLREADFAKTAGLSLEEVSQLFGDEVVVDLTHASDEEKKKIDEAIKEKEGMVPETFENKN